MFDAKTAIRIQEAIRNEHRAVPYLEDIMFKMALVPVASHFSYSVFSLQSGDLTTLVALFTDENGEITDIRVKLISW